MVVVKFLVFVSKVVSIFSKILKRIPLPHQLNYWGAQALAAPPKSTLITVRGVDLGAAPAARAPIIQKRLCFHQLSPPFTLPQYLGFLQNVFDKSTPVIVIVRGVA